MSIKFTILGCGSSVGVPSANGNWGLCNPKEVKNYRTRCSALVSKKKTNILIDTSPDLRSQLIKNKIKNINAVLYTHQHADQTHGINDLRSFFLSHKKKIPVFADTLTYNYLLSNFSYCFKGTDSYPSTLNLKIIKKKIEIDEILFNAIPVQHGNIDSLCYLINNTCAYASDINFIYKKNLNFFYKLNFLIVDCLRFKPHPSHYNLDDVLDLIKEIKPNKTILTNLNSELDYNNLLKFLPKNVIPAFDGLSFNI
jgi:phosphoribosyl 1,2-cyclic phosphate phosphodiesterase